GFRRLGILSELPPGAPLAQQVPALVERHLNALQLRLVRLGRLALGLAFEQGMFLARQLVDPVRDLLVIHGIPPWSVRITGPLDSRIASTLKQGAIALAHRSSRPLEQIAPPHRFSSMYIRNGLKEVFAYERS